MEGVITHCAEHCLICGSKLAFSGVKPIVCEKPSCIFSYEQFGLGVDIESEIMKHPDIVDLKLNRCELHDLAALKGLSGLRKLSVAFGPLSNANVHFCANFLLQCFGQCLIGFIPRILVLP